MSYFKEHAVSYSRFILVLLILSLLFGCCYNIRRANREEKWIKHQEEVILHIAKIRLTLIEAESRAIHFILTGDRFFLNEYVLQKNKALHELNVVNALMGHTALSSRLLDAAKVETTAVLESCEGMIRVKRDSATAESAGLAQRGLETKNRAQADLLLSNLELKENRTLETRRLVFQKATFGMNLSIFLTCISFLFMLLALIKQSRKKSLECSQLVIELSHSAADLERLNHKLVIQNRALEQFAHMVSHDLRAPVANIIGLGNILEMLDEDSQDKDVVISHVVSSVNKFDHILRNLNHVLQLENEVAEKECL